MHSEAIVRHFEKKKVLAFIIVLYYIFFVSYLRKYQFTVRELNFHYSMSALKHSHSFWKNVSQSC